MEPSRARATLVCAAGAGGGAGPQRSLPGIARGGTVSDGATVEREAAEPGSAQYEGRSTAAGGHGAGVRGRYVYWVVSHEMGLGVA